MTNMNVVLHVGPHKTGTTSLQAVLGQTFSQQRSHALWYPPPQKNGPGHAVIAWEVIGRTNPQGAMPSLKKVLAEAEETRVSTLVLSAEALSFASEKRLHMLHQLFGGHRLEVVVTLSPFQRRVVSQWQEFVKHGWVKGLNDSIADVLSESPGLGTQFLHDYKNALKPNKTWILVPPRRAFPGWLLNEFWSVLVNVNPNLRVSPPWQSDTVLNRSLGAVEANLLMEMNRSFGRLTSLDSRVDYGRLRSLFLEMFRSPRWSKTIPHVPLKLDEKWTPLVEHHAEMQYQCVAELAKSSDVKVLGDLDVIRH